MGFRVSLNMTGSSSIRKKLESNSETANKASDLAVSSAARYATPRIKSGIRKQVNLKKSYIDSNVSVQFGKVGERRVATIIGRFRPTSLRRFDARQLYAGSPSGRKRQGVSVKVKRSRKRIPRGFLLNLKNGNQGLAIRVSENEQPKRLYNAKPIYENVYLLYGPSVQQVMDDVIPDEENNISVHLETEFYRHYNRLNNGGK